MQKKLIWPLLTVIAATIIIIGFKNFGFPKQQQANQNSTLEKINIATSFYPLYDFAQNVGGNFVSVTNITPPGSEPHDYEPTPKDIVKIYQSKLLILNGNGVDAWGEKIEQELKDKGIAVLKMSNSLNSLKNSSKGGESYDPHFWLDPENAKKETELIYEELVKIDPSHKQEYNKNAESYLQKLETLNQNYKDGLKQCEQNTIVTSHNAFNYLASRYGLNTLYILGLSPDQEPAPKTIADVAEAVKQKNIQYIFFESLVSPKLAQTIASETGAKTLELNPIEGFTAEEIASGKNYITQMQNNLNNLKVALKCQ